MTTAVRGAVASEWTKFWSVRATWWCLVAATALMLGYSTLSAIAQRYNDDPSGADTIALGGGFYLAQFAVIALATLFVTSEYTGGGIRSTLLWTPARPRVVVAKAAVLVPVLAVFGVLLACAGMALAAGLKDGYGLPTSFEGAFTTASGMGGYFALLGLLSTGAGWALRSAAGTLMSVIVLLVPLPLIVASLGQPELVAYFPGIAGVNATVEAGHPNPITMTAAPYAPWVGLVVCAVWAVVALAVGTAVLRRRDA
ncbi:ABC-2 type transport system permease protein [Amycolatopsis lexingtonensis]|uniref:ABC-2 type transport system permease protein n=1 Tax=Amycolatopsis lexingtonensis TaxID=218822 RepID=A0ABR9I5A0_9PSEU|nr:ABC transporter permease subunit [Amycolatopsis lexingtonensis]MBE1498360.1 ABC-2 type transport system permease protein [Amycolatopsis lexingtonensis]